MECVYSERNACMYLDDGCALDVIVPLMDFAI